MTSKKISWMIICAFALNRGKVTSGKEKVMQVNFSYQIFYLISIKWITFTNFAPGFILKSTISLRKIYRKQRLSPNACPGSPGYRTATQDVAGIICFLWFHLFYDCCCPIQHVVCLLIGMLKFFFLLFYISCSVEFT